MTQVADQPPPPPDCPRVVIREIRPGDGGELRRFHAALSPESIYLRYFTAHPELSDRDVHRFTHVDGTDRLAVVAIDATRLVGVARADRDTGTETAEVAVIVADDLHRHGIATALLERLVRDANHVGIRTFEAETLLSNQPMLAVFHHLGFPVTSFIETGVAQLSFPIGPTVDYDQACRNRRSTLVIEDVATSDVARP